MPIRMIRPQWNEYIDRVRGTHVVCTCGDSLQTLAQVRDHWQRGHCDEVDIKPFPIENQSEVESLIYSIGRMMGAPGLNGDPVVTPVAVLRWLFAHLYASKEPK